MASEQSKGRRPLWIPLALVLVVVVLFAAAVYPASKTTTTTSATTSQTNTTTSTGGSSPGSVFLLDVNGTWYWADNISNDIVIGDPGYSYFLNGSVTFDGLTFQTICLTLYQGCPGSGSSSTVVEAQAIQMKITFPDGTSETIGRAGTFESLPTYILTVEHTSPQAGIAVEYVGDYSSSTPPYAVFLLVSSCGGSPYLC